MRRLLEPLSALAATLSHPSREFLEVLPREPLNNPLNLFDSAYAAKVVQWRFADKQQSTMLAGAS
jgi:hypothetical protein